MRDIKRIDKILLALKKYWIDNPDLRLGQIIVNITQCGHDPFYLEDETLLKHLKGLNNE